MHCSPLVGGKLRTWTFDGLANRGVALLNRSAQGNHEISYGYRSLGAELELLDRSVAEVARFAPSRATSWRLAALDAACRNAEMMLKRRNPRIANLSEPRSILLQIS